MSKENKKTNIERRELIKGLATVPVLGVFLVNVLRKIKRDAEKKANLLSNLIQEKSPPAAVKSLSNSKHLNLGVIGYGGRGAHLVRAAGFATKGWTDTASENAQKNKLNKQFETFMTQEDLNCSLVGVCDLFDNNAELGIDASKNEVGPGGAPKCPYTLSSGRTDPCHTTIDVVRADLDSRILFPTIIILRRLQLNSTFDSIQNLFMNYKKVNISRYRNRSCDRNS